MDIDTLFGKHPGIMCDICSGHAVGKDSDIDSGILFGKSDTPCAVLFGYKSDILSGVASGLFWQASWCSF